MERVVVALGGNALLRRGADDTFEEMYRAARAAAERIADIVAEGWEVVVTHGNGPQVGRILIQQAAAAETVSPMPLDVCGAESQGQLDEMAKIIDAADADLVVVGTPIDLRGVIDIRKPAVRVRYDLEVLPDSPQLLDVLQPVLRPRSAA